MDFWIIFAVLAALSQGSASLVGEFLQVRSIHVLVWMRGIALIVMLPVFWLVQPPEQWPFYVLVLGTAACFSYFDVMYLTRSAQKGAGVISRFEGIIVGVTFFLWLLLDPALVLDYVREPLRGGGIALSLFACIYFALKLRKCEISLSALKSMLPAFLLAGAGVVMGKMAMNYSDYHSGVWYYAVCQSVYVLVIYLAFAHVPVLSKRFQTSGGQRFFDRKVVMAGLSVALCWLLHTPPKYYAISVVENPAYVTVIGLSAPLWVILVYRFVGRREEVDVWSGLGIMASAIALVIFTQF